MLIIINNIILIILLGLSIFFDVKKRKIPNFLTFPVIIWALTTSTIFNGLSGLLFSIFGFLAGMLVFLIPYAMGGMGAGDVKLMGAIGSLMGWRFILKTALLTGIVGGLLAFGYLVYSGRLLQVLKSIAAVLLKPILRFIYLRTDNKKMFKIYSYFNQEDNNSDKIYLPYGLAIGIGAILVMSGKFKGIFPF